MRTWLKGGLIGLGIIVSIFLIDILLGLPSPFSGEGSMFIFFLSSLPFLVVFDFFDKNPYSWLFAFTIYTTVTFLAYFLVGAIIGWIVGKIKSSK